ncbi:MAG: AraC family transcriptional regulator, partial [Cyanobacteria bacterium CRU_2_1]|nr:AraC family transcriptional regulator [Cyanobacteria bacterium CRU_2_1]
MLKTKSVTEKLASPIELDQRSNNKALVLSSQQMDWNGILVEQHQYPTTPGEIEEEEFPALSDHWLILSLEHLEHLEHLGRFCIGSDARFHESTFQKGDSLLFPAGKPIYWRCPKSHSSQTELHIHLQPELVGQVAQGSEIDIKQFLTNHFAKQDLNLQHIAMLLLAELRSSGI